MMGFDHLIEDALKRWLKVVGCLLLLGLIFLVIGGTVGMTYMMAGC